MVIASTPRRISDDEEANTLKRMMSVSLSGWIVQDGNYGDFSVGSVYPFALEFHPETEIVVRNGEMNDVWPSMRWKIGSIYSVEGTVAFVGNEWWVLDAGLPMYLDHQPPPGPAGTCVSGDVIVGVDHFSYFERLAFERGAPPLIFNWLIEKITLDTTPWIETHTRFFERDATRRSERQVERTDVWGDDDAAFIPDYTLTCTLVEGRPARNTR